MIKKNPLAQPTVIEPMKVSVLKENISESDCLRMWKPIYTAIFAMSVLIMSGYLLFKIIN